MDIKEARAKLNSINKSMTTKPSRVLIGELYDIVEFLLDEIERIKSPPMTTLVAECPCDPSDDRGYQPRRLSRKPDERGYLPIRRKLPLPPISEKEK